MKKFEVKIYYSSFCSYEVDAKNSNEAIGKARVLKINQNEFLTNLENWKDADTVEKIKQ